MGLLQRYREARSANPQITDAFLSAPDLDSALAAAAALLDERDLASLEVAVLQLAPRYRRIWAGGQVATRFVARVRDDPSREDLAGFLADVTRFHGVSPANEPRARVLPVPVPVRSGVAPHARAHGRHLLLEIRRSDELRDQVGPLVREIVRFLFDGIAEERRDGLRDAVRGTGDAGERTWRLLRDALPVAIAQGVAAERFDERWSAARPWCDDREIDRYAKALFPLVKRTLASRGRLDRRFVAEAAGLLPAAP